MYFPLDFLVIPHPRDLRIERQLSNSVMMAWHPPVSLPTDQIQSYQVFIDGVYKMTVASTDRTKALIENIDHNKVS